MDKVLGENIEKKMNKRRNRSREKAFIRLKDVSKCYCEATIDNYTRLKSLGLNLNGINATGKYISISNRGCFQYVSEIPKGRKEIVYDIESMKWVYRKELEIFTAHGFKIPEMFNAYLKFTSYKDKIVGYVMVQNQKHARWWNKKGECFMLNSNRDKYFDMSLI